MDRRVSSKKDVDASLLRILLYEIIYTKCIP